MYNILLWVRWRYILISIFTLHQSMSEGNFRSLSIWGGTHKRRTHKTMLLQYLPLRSIHLFIYIWARDCFRAEWVISSTKLKTIDVNNKVQKYIRMPKILIVSNHKASHSELRLALSCRIKTSKGVAGCLWNITELLCCDIIHS